MKIETKKKTIVIHLWPQNEMVLYMVLVALLIGAGIVGSIFEAKWKHEYEMTHDVKPKVNVINTFRNYYKDLV